MERILQRQDELAQQVFTHNQLLSLICIMSITHALDHDACFCYQVQKLSKQLSEQGKMVGRKGGREEQQEKEE